MIIVTIEMCGAVSKRREVLGRMAICNRGDSTNPMRGNYDVAVQRRGASPETILTSPARQGEVLDYPRLSYNVWRLVLRALRSAFPEERGQAGAG